MLNKQLIGTITSKPDESPETLSSGKLRFENMTSGAPACCKLGISGRPWFEYRDFKFDWNGNPTRRKAVSNLHVDGGEEGEEADDDAEEDYVD